MVIPIPIPVTERLVVAAEGTVWKFVTCSSCQEEFAYLLQLEAIGEVSKVIFMDNEEATQEAYAHAQRNLAKKSENVVLPTPCPCCGMYQEEMAAILKEEAYHDRIFGVGMAVTVLSFIPLALSIPNNWLVTIVGVAIGGAIMGYVELAAALYDPNSGDPEPRKRLGKKHTVWGENLAKLRAMLAESEPEVQRPASK